jgi:predicted metal-dependent peptidase
MNSYSFDFNTIDIYTRAMRRVSRYGQLAYGKLLSLRLLATNGTPFGATDGRTLYLNPEGLRKLEQTSDPVGYCAFLLVHEALHAQLSHATRLRHLTDHNTANMAADYVINAMIVEMNRSALHAGAKTAPFPLIDRVLVDESLSQDRHVVELYNILKVQQQQQPPQPPQPQPQPQPPHDDDDGADDAADAAADADGNGGDSGDSDGNGTDGDSDGDSDGNGTDGDSGDSDGNGTDGDSDGDSDGTGTGGDSEGKGKGKGKPATDGEILGDWVGTATSEGDLAEPDLKNGETLADFENSVDQANESIELQDKLSASAGLGDGALRQLSEQRRRWAGLDWVEYVRQWMTDRIDNGWNKPLNINTYATTGLVEDDRSANNMGELAVVIDTSISVPASVVREMLDATQDALNTLNPRAIHLLSFDHKVQEYHELTAGDTVPQSLKGGGGTLFSTAFKFLDEVAPNVDGILFLTDGEAADWDRVVEPQAPVLWLDWNPWRTVQYPFGEVIKVISK